MANYNLNIMISSRLRNFYVSWLVKDFNSNWINWLNRVAERYIVHLSLEDNEPSVMGGSNPSKDGRTVAKCSTHSSVNPGTKFTKVSYLRKFNLIF